MNVITAVSAVRVHVKKLLFVDEGTLKEPFILSFLLPSRKFGEKSLLSIHGYLGFKVLVCHVN